MTSLMLARQQSGSVVAKASSHDRYPTATARKGEYLGAPSFTHSDVEYNGNKVSTVGRDEIREENSTSDFESVRFNRILPARPKRGGEFLMGPRLQGC
jgi:hypothetical protein